MIITDINHVSFTVSNLDTSVKYYRDVLGLKVIDISERSSSFASKATGIPGARLKIAYLSVNNCSVELIQYLSPKGKKIDTSTCNIGSAHLCFNVDKIKELVKRIKEDGGKIISEPLKIPGGPNKGKLMFYAEDPDSNTLEFISNKRY